MADIVVRPLRDADHAGWLALYRGYMRFYRRPEDPAVAATVWRWLLDAAHPLEGLGATRAGALLGLAHFRAMPRPLRGCAMGFLDDLYVAEAARGAGVAEALMREIAAIGLARGWESVRWITAEDNARAKRLYDRVGARVPFDLYEFDCAALAASSH